MSVGCIEDGDQGKDGWSKDRSRCEIFVEGSVDDDCALRLPWGG